MNIDIYADKYDNDLFFTIREKHENIQFLSFCCQFLLNVD